MAMNLSFVVFPKCEVINRQCANPNKYHPQLESVQSNSALDITCVCGTSKEKLYTQLVLTSLSDRRQFHRLSLCYKMIKRITSAYLKCHIPNPAINLYNTRRSRENSTCTHIPNPAINLYNIRRIRENSTCTLNPLYPYP